MFPQVGVLPPVRSDLENLDALPGDTECQIDLVTDMRSGSPPFDECGYQLFTTLGVEFSQCHSGFIKQKTGSYLNIEPSTVTECLGGPALRILGLILIANLKKAARSKPTSLARVRASRSQCLASATFAIFNTK